MNIKMLSLIIMYALHILVDFHLQGLFINLKQKSWWHKELLPLTDEEKELYKNDYLVGLILHSFEWTFFFMIPVFFIASNTLYVLIAIIINTIIHAIVDDSKCNKGRINLIQDQSIHTLQIIITWIVFFFLI